MRFGQGTGGPRCGRHVEESVMGLGKKVKDKGKELKGKSKKNAGKAPATTVCGPRGRSKS